MTPAWGEFDHANDLITKPTARGMIYEAKESKLLSSVIPLSF